MSCCVMDMKFRGAGFVLSAGFSNSNVNPW